MWVTTSGMFSLGPMACLLSTTKPDRIMFSVDYPLAKNQQGLECMNRLQESGMLTDKQFADISYGIPPVCFGLIE